VGKLSHTILRPIHVLSIVALLVGTTVMGALSATTSVAREELAREELDDPSAVGSETLQEHHGSPSNEPLISLQPPELFTGAWRLDTYSSDGFLTPVADGTIITAEFDRDTISGHASCNSYSGPYRANDYVISIGPLLTTRMACDRDVMDQEQAYLDALESAATFTVQATTLTLAEEGGQPVAIFGKSLLSTSMPTSEGL
jgi:heat shock protein HslJ